MAKKPTRIEPTAPGKAWSEVTSRTSSRLTSDLTNLPPNQPEAPTRRPMGMPAHASMNPEPGVIPARPHRAPLGINQTKKARRKRDTAYAIGQHTVDIPPPLSLPRLPHLFT